MNYTEKLTGFSVYVIPRYICGCCDVYFSRTMYPFARPRKMDVHSEGGDRLETQSPPRTRAPYEDTEGRDDRRDGQEVKRCPEDPAGQELTDVTHEKPSFVRKTATARSSPLTRALSRHMERTLAANVRAARKLAGHCCGKPDPLPARTPSRAIRERILFSPRRPANITTTRTILCRYRATGLSSALLFAYCIFARYRSRCLGGGR